MTIYVDEIREYPGKGRWSHMWTDGADAELDIFATALSLKKEWAHLSNGVSGRFYHYDVVPAIRKQAIWKGAVVMPLKQWITDKMRGIQ